MKVEFKAEKNGKELVIVTEVSREQLPFLLQEINRKLDEFLSELNHQ